MPFISAKDRRGLMASGQMPLIAPEIKNDPTWGDVFDAAVGTTIDENLSASRLFNQEQFKRRDQNVIRLIDDGVIQPSEYEYGNGKFDFNKLSLALRETEYADLVKTDSELREERNEYLANKRRYAESVLAEGPGMAQFLGMGTAYMLDPINIATMGVGTLPAAAKGLTAMATARITAARTAGLLAASETAIQPFVYSYKQDIESPYSARNALAAIATAAAGGAAIGGVTGGIAGFLRRAKTSVGEDVAGTPNITRQNAEDLAADPDAPTEPPYTPTQELSQADRSLQEVIDYLELARAERDPTPWQIVDEEYGRYLDAQVKIAEKEKQKIIKRLITEQSKLSKSQKWAQWIRKKGGLNKEAWMAEGIEPGAFANMWRAGDKGLKPDDLAELIMDDPSISIFDLGDFASARGFDANDAVEFVSALLRDPDKYVDPSIQRRIDEFDEQIRQIDEAPVDDPTDKIYRDAAIRVVRDDEELLAELEAHRERMREPALTEEFFARPEPPRRADAAVISRERELLQSQGIQESYDEAMDAYNKLPEDNRKLYIDGEEIDANVIVREIDEQLEEINDLIRCLRGG